ncbi:nicotinamidase KNAG_0D03760 [Huiozyma naganishii CBS 8797]|uniref:nicotinamidase n=1 Tax=Huiozyma naganishii (strain ATCC MYA-139 / BCRC 22969 / CBS 8797 / KCTC 17520 / NBRC 10181 / NCYC 3082 / Yp74L-3) TaxID=1071383 RepID=J7RYA7_HUIN7|nr:hypothetical protein KNAG_0D03760 [Kazachstania naganishii CBS 8797]CCK70122.1 hypothetical protein KNAG_0D03760 [Kazachstania naganishii CBS 8797]
MKTLIVVDVQNDFLPPKGSLAVPHGDEVIDPIIELINDPAQDWHRVVFTKDWHPKKHTSFAITHNQPEFSKYTYKSPRFGDLTTQEGTLWPVHCVQNTWGAQITNKLMKEVSKHHFKIVDKGFLRDREYYSAFHDIWKFHRTDLDDYLRKHHTTEVYIVGLALDFCVKCTAISAAELGYKTTILKDYTRAINTDDESMAKLEKELQENDVALV